MTAPRRFAFLRRQVHPQLKATSQRNGNQHSRVMNFIWPRLPITPLRQIEGQFKSGRVVSYSGSPCQPVIKTPMLILNFLTLYRVCLRQPATACRREEMRMMRIAILLSTFCAASVLASATESTNADNNYNEQTLTALSEGGKCLRTL